MDADWAVRTSMNGGPRVVGASWKRLLSMLCFVVCNHLIAQLFVTPFLHAESNGSLMGRPPSAVRLMSLSASPGMSEGLSAQYEDMSLSGPSLAVTKWRTHFA